jgi:hypothetical protein
MMEELLAHMRLSWNTTQKAKIAYKQLRKLAKYDRFRLLKNLARTFRSILSVLVAANAPTDLIDNLMRNGGRADREQMNAATAKASVWLTKWRQTTMKKVSLARGGNTVQDDTTRGYTIATIVAAPDEPLSPDAQDALKTIISDISLIYKYTRDAIKVERRNLDRSTGGVQPDQLQLTLEAARYAAASKWLDQSKVQYIAETAYWTRPSVGRSQAMISESAIAETLLTALKQAHYEYIESIGYDDRERRNDGFIGSYLGMIQAAGAASRWDYDAPQRRASRRNDPFGSMGIINIGGAQRRYIESVRATQATLEHINVQATYNAVRVEQERIAAAQQADRERRLAAARAERERLAALVLTEKQLRQAIAAVTPNGLSVFDKWVIYELVTAFGSADITLEMFRGYQDRLEPYYQAIYTGGDHALRDDPAYFIAEYNARRHYGLRGNNDVPELFDDKYPALAQWLRWKNVDRDLLTNRETREPIFERVTRSTRSRPEPTRVVLMRDVANYRYDYENQGPVIATGTYIDAPRYNFATTHEPEYSGGLAVPRARALPAAMSGRVAPAASVTSAASAASAAPDEAYDSDDSDYSIESGAFGSDDGAPFVRVVDTLPSYLEASYDADHALSADEYDAFMIDLTPAGYGEYDRKVFLEMFRTEYHSKTEIRGAAQEIRTYHEAIQRGGNHSYRQLGRYVAARITAQLDGVSDCPDRYPRLCSLIRNDDATYGLITETQTMDLLLARGDDWELVRDIRNYRYDQTNSSW